MNKLSKELKGERFSPHIFFNVLYYYIFTSSLHYWSDFANIKCLNSLGQRPLFHNTSVASDPTFCPRPEETRKGFCLSSRKTPCCIQEGLFIFIWLFCFIFNISVIVLFNLLGFPRVEQTLRSIFEKSQLLLSPTSWPWDLRRIQFTSTSSFLISMPFHASQPLLLVPLTSCLRHTLFLAPLTTLCYTTCTLSFRPLCTT